MNDVRLWNPVAWEHDIGFYSVTLFPVTTHMVSNTCYLYITHIPPFAGSSAISSQVQAMDSYLDCRPTVLPTAGVPSLQSILNVNLLTHSSYYVNTAAQQLLMTLH